MKRDNDLIPELSCSAVILTHFRYNACVTQEGVSCQEENPLNPPYQGDFKLCAYNDRLSLASRPGHPTHHPPTCAG